jgi:hypothetical protein
MLHLTPQALLDQLLAESDKPLPAEGEESITDYLSCAVVLVDDAGAELGVSATVTLRIGQSDDPADGPEAQRARIAVCHLRGAGNQLGGHRRHLPMRDLDGTRQITETVEIPDPTDEEPDRKREETQRRVVARTLRGLLGELVDEAKDWQPRPGDGWSKVVTALRDAANQGDR